MAYDNEIVTRVMRATVQALTDDGRADVAEHVLEPGATVMVMRSDEYGVWWADIHLDDQVVVSVDLRAIGAHDVDGHLLLLDTPLG